MTTNSAPWPIDEPKRAFFRRRFKQKFRPYAIELGMFVYSWNRLQEVLGRLFWSTSRMDGMVAMKVWYSQLDDRAQRRLLASAVEGAHDIKTLSDRLKSEIDWLWDKCNSLAGRRNNVIHTPFSYDPDQGTFAAAYEFGNPRATELKGKDLLKEFRWNREYADELSD